MRSHSAPKAKCTSAVARARPSNVPITRSRPKLKVPAKSGFSTIAVVIGIQNPCDMPAMLSPATAIARQTLQGVATGDRRQAQVGAQDCERIAGAQRARQARFMLFEAQLAATAGELGVAH